MANSILESDYTELKPVGYTPIPLKPATAATRSLKSTESTPSSLKPTTFASTPQPRVSTTTSTKLEPEYIEIFDTWKADPSKENTAVILKILDPVIDKAIRAYAGPAAESPTIKAEAKKLAIEALQSYDPQRASLRTHIMTRMQRLRRIAAQQRQIIRVPEQVGLDMMRIDIAIRELEDQLGRPPSDAELADYTGLSRKRLEYIRTAGRPHAEGSFTSEAGTETQIYEPSVTTLHQTTDQWAELVYDDLDPVDQYIMERALGMHGHTPISATEIAKQLKLSPAAVSQRMAKIQEKLDQRESLGVL